MATIDLTKRDDVLNPNSTFFNRSPVTVVTGTIDFAAATLVKGGVLAVSDVIKVLVIPKGAFVQGVVYKTVSVTGAVCTFSLGDNTTAAQFGTPFDANTVLDSIGGTTGKYYTADNNVNITLLSGAPTVGVITVSAVYTMMQK